MAKNWAKTFYNSDKWFSCRASFIAERVAIDGGMCQRCKNNLGYIVHHTTILTEQNIKNPDVSLNHSKLEYLCKDCHDKEKGHFLDRRYKKRAATRKGLKFDADGQLIQQK